MIRLRTDSPALGTLAATRFTASNTLAGCTFFTPVSSCFADGPSDGYITWVNNAKKAWTVRAGGESKRVSHEGR
jgi:hypothetical protein